VIALLLMLQLPVTARPDTVKPVHDAIRYDIMIAVSDTGAHFVGEVETTWVLASDEPLVVPLDSAMRVVRVLIDGTENSRVHRTEYGRKDNIIYIPHDKHAGDTLITRIRYHGVARDGLVVRVAPDSSRTFFADNWPDRAHLWLPVQDHPSDKAMVSMRVEVPADYKVIANGNLVKIDTLARGRAAWQYRLDTPIPVSNIVMGAARMTVTPLTAASCSAPCVPQTAWAYPQDSAYAAQAFSVAPAIVEWFSATFGAFPYPSLAHVESSTRFGGMENATAIFYADGMYAKRSLPEEIIAHETAHQWFGDAVTETDWHHLWLSEGFATYLAALWMGHAHGDSVFVRRMQENAETVFYKEGHRATGTRTPNPVTEQPIIDTTATDLMGLLNSNNYPKGAWVLHELRGLVGDSVFFAGMREYYREYRNGNALSGQFETVMEKASGKDLGWFFNQALGLPGYPMLTVTWAAKGKKADLTITQAQPAAWGLRMIPGLEISVDGKVTTVNLDAATARVSVATSSNPPVIVVDPAHKWLLQSKVERAP
jgi:aminopeptidase N